MKRYLMSNGGIMDTQDFMLKDINGYLSLKNPGGALLIKGEWGCGKTYYINHTLLSENENLVFIKVSLFGLNSYEELLSCVKESFINQQIKEYGIENYFDLNSKKAKTIKQIVKNLLPDKEKAIISALYQGLLGLSNTINGKRVVFIYDDFERVKMDSDIVLGFINNQIENLNTSVIIVANEHEILENECKSNSKYFLSYAASQEKVIQRRIQFKENYNDIISRYIDNAKEISSEREYYEFLKETKEEITKMFMEKNGIKNLRSLLIALQNFEFLYALFVEHTLIKKEQIKGFLMSFLAYSIVARKYVIPLTDNKRFDIIKRIYPLHFDNQFMWLPIEQWILKGDFDKELFLQYLSNWIKANLECSPDIMIRRINLCEMEDKDIREGVKLVLEDIYSGKVTFQEYIRFINNIYIGCQIGYGNLFGSIEWNKVKEGINILINKCLKSNSGIERPHINFDKSKYNKEEKECVDLIDDFLSKKLDGLDKKGEFLSSLQKENIEWRKVIATLGSYFDSEMAHAFLKRYIDANNKNKVMIQTIFLDYCKVNWKHSNAGNKEGIYVIYNSLMKMSELIKNQDGKYIETYNVQLFLNDLSEYIIQ